MQIYKTQPKENKFNAIEADPDDPEYDFYVGTIQEDNQCRDWSVEMNISGHIVMFKLDSGAQCNVLLLHVYKSLSQAKLEKSMARLTSYTGHRMNTVGKTTLLLSHRNKYYPVEFQVVDCAEKEPVLGLSTCVDMQLIS